MQGKKSRRSQHSLYSRTTEHPAAALVSSSFVCHTLLAPPGQVSLRGYSIHSPCDKWRHRLLPPPFMRQIETCVKEIHFCTFSKCWWPADVRCLSSGTIQIIPPFVSTVRENYSFSVVQLKICSLLCFTDSLFTFRAVEGIPQLCCLQNGEPVFAYLAFFF